MRDELLNVLEGKLDSIKKNIESLDLINSRLNEEEDNLSYVDGILKLFKEDDEYNINNFSKLERDDFDTCIGLVPETTKEKFETNSCNYDGLVYIINGINNGISLVLTEEQESAIQLLINGLSDKRIDYQARIEGINLAKSRLEVSDMKVLNNNRDKYETILDELDKNEYVSETEDVLTAINYANLEQDKTVDVLSYLLKYNADIYSSGKPPKEEKEVFTKVEEEINNEEVELEQEVNELPEVPEEVPTEEEAPSEEPLEVEIPEEKEEDEEPEVETKEEHQEVPADIQDEINNLTEATEETPDEEKTIELSGLVSDDTVEFTSPEIETPVEPEVEVDNDETKEINLINKEQLDKVFKDYHISLDDVEGNEELLDGDIEGYKDILNNLSNNGVISVVSKNQLLLKNILKDSDNDLLTKVFDIVRNDFSVDDDDYEETLKITFDSLPSIFVKEPTGTYENFIKNVEMFKRLNFDLINLFDFSRELLVADNDLLEKNYSLVSPYEVRVDEKNAKYLLALKDVYEKMDYYVEAVYDDKITKKTFDGMNIIRMYPSKLDSVTDLTIKRLRYSSENSKKMFGSRENSIAGEVANLKVDVLEIPDHYFGTFFNNEFDDITNEELLSYEQMIRDNTNYEFNEDDILKELSTYRDGMRYNIEGINVSYNKVLRNYNILKDNNVDTNKALEYAVCNNLVITKDEYMKLKEVLNTLGGK